MPVFLILALWAFGAVTDTARWLSVRGRRDDPPCAGLFFLDDALLACTGRDIRRIPRAAVVDIRGFVRSVGVDGEP